MTLINKRPRHSWYTLCIHMLDFSQFEKYLKGAAGGEALRSKRFFCYSKHLYLRRGPFQLLKYKQILSKFFTNVHKYEEKQAFLLILYVSHGAHGAYGAQGTALH